jgi:DNA-binding MarR family transcriptional regulator
LTATRQDPPRSGQSTADHEQLLHQAVQRLLTLGQVMRLAAHEVRGELTSVDQAGGVGTASVAPGSACGFGDAQFHVLHAVAAAGSLTVGEIAERSHVATPTISKMLKHLEANGLIERHVDRSNRRVVHVVLTDAGRSAETRMGRQFQTALARVLRPLTSSELADLIAAFGHLERLVGPAPDVRYVSARPHAHKERDSIDAKR